jgi:hypothetical protein
MIVWRTRTFAIRSPIRTVLLTLAASAFLLTILIGNFRQSQLTQEALARARAAEQAAARAQADAERVRAQTEPPPPKDGAVRRTSRQDPKDAERVRQLYEEINSLSRMQERIQGDLHNLRTQAAQRAPR